MSGIFEEYDKYEANRIIRELSVANKRLRNVEAAAAWVFECRDMWHWLVTKGSVPLHPNTHVIFYHANNEVDATYQQALADLRRAVENRP